jgi:hypothetical protein
VFQKGRFIQPQQRTGGTPVPPAKIPTPLRPQSAISKGIASGKHSWHFCCMKTILSKRASSSTDVDAEVRQLRAAGKRIAANKKSALRILAATGMYTLKGQLKPQFR